MVAQTNTNHPVVFNFGLCSIRTIETDGQVWFVAKDVCQALEVANHKHAVTRLDDDERDGVVLNDSIGRPQELTAINESGLYNLILSSRKSSAKQFKRWVTHEVLPSIRRTGGYHQGSSTASSPSDQYAKAAQIAPELMEILRSFNLPEDTANSIAIEQLRIETGLHLLSAFKAVKANEKMPEENLQWIQAEATRLVSMIPDDCVSMTHTFLENLVAIRDTLPIKQ